MERLEELIQPLEEDGVGLGERDAPQHADLLVHLIRLQRRLLAHVLAVVVQQVEQVAQIHGRLPGALDGVADRVVKIAEHAARILRLLAGLLHHLEECSVVILASPFVDEPGQRAVQIVPRLGHLREQCADIHLAGRAVEGGVEHQDLAMLGHPIALRLAEVDELAGRREVGECKLVGWAELGDDCLQIAARKTELLAVLEVSHLHQRSSCQQPARIYRISGAGLGLRGRCQQPRRGRRRHTGLHEGRAMPPDILVDPAGAI